MAQICWVSSCCRLFLGRGLEELLPVPLAAQKDRFWVNSEVQKCEPSWNPELPPPVSHSVSPEVIKPPKKPEIPEEVMAWWLFLCLRKTAYD